MTFYWLQHMFDAYYAQMCARKLLPITIMGRAEGLTWTDLGVLTMIEMIINLLKPVKRLSKGLKYFLQLLTYKNKNYDLNSASTDGGARSQVYARLTLILAPHHHRHCSV